MDCKHVQLHMVCIKYQRGFDKTEIKHASSYDSRSFEMTKRALLDLFVQNYAVYVMNSKKVH